MFVTVYRIFIIICFLFFVGASFGWLLELFFRRYISKANPERKWLNPGFLTGPYLPLYGFGVIALFILSLFEKTIVKYDTGGPLHWIIMFTVMSFIMTLIEYIAGIIFIKGMNIKLWDYTEEKFNIHGIICLKFSIIWGVLSILYYFFVYPKLTILVEWFVQHPFFSFSVGTIFGIFIIDVIVSLNLGVVLRQKAKMIDEKFAVIDYKRIQFLTRAKFFSIHNRRSLVERLDKIEEFVKRRPDKA